MGWFSLTGATSEGCRPPMLHSTYMYSILKCWFQYNVILGSLTYTHYHCQCCCVYSSGNNLFSASVTSAVGSIAQSKYIRHHAITAWQQWVDCSLLTLDWMLSCIFFSTRYLKYRHGDLIYLTLVFTQIKWSMSLLCVMCAEAELLLHLTLIIVHFASS